MFSKDVIFHYSFTAFCIKKDYFKRCNYLIRMFVLCKLHKVNVHQFWKWSVNYFSSSDVRKLNKFCFERNAFKVSKTESRESRERKKNLEKILKKSTIRNVMRILIVISIFLKSYYKISKKKLVNKKTNNVTFF